MQVATIEYARHKAGLANANSTEFDPHTPHPVIALIDEWEDADGSIQKRDANSDLGGTMRLGAQSSDVEPGTLASQIYGKVVTERHRHRYEANEHYLGQRLQEAGLIISALTQRERLTEIVELPAGRAPVVRRRAVPPRVQVDALGRPSAVHQLHQGRAGAHHAAADASSSPEGRRLTGAGAPPRPRLRYAPL